MSASTVLSVGFMMSMRRLCVRSSNWSRASLSPCGETSSVNFSIFVGSGTGPLTVAPVRLAVSTISRAEVSIRRWSKALRRIRMFWLAICVSFLKSDQAESYLADVSDLWCADALHAHRFSSSRRTGTDFAKPKSEPVPGLRLLQDLRDDAGA